MKRITNNIKYQVSPQGVLWTSIKYSSLYFVLCTLYFVLVLTSCHKAGSGGEVMLMITAEHHGIKIINHVGYPDTVFLKYNADELPGTKPSDYDIFFVGTPRNDEVDCDNLKWGKYYVYMVGYDSLYGGRVRGGIPLKIKRSQQKEMIMVTVPVVE
ncbi:MAG: hypothetical protein HY841_06420 [Bacteroidetes bacterium]|nr:hypothetical protein [Bacteroidota bacterium]